MIMNEELILDEKVALRKESVDRNYAVQIVIVVMHASLSARRAWIEIGGAGQLIKSSMSLSARRAWIEIRRCVLSGKCC